MTTETETFAGGHGAPSTIAFYAPDQKRNVLGEFDKEDGSGEDTDWEKAKGMSVGEWDKLTDKQRASLLAAVYVADADKKPGAAAALAKLRGWVAGGKERKAAGKKAAGAAKGAADKKKREAEAKAKKAQAEKDRAARTLEARRVRPDSVNSSHRDGYVLGETEKGDARMRWDDAHSSWVVEKKDKSGWKESRRLSSEQAYNELSKRGGPGWYRPKVQPYLKPPAKKTPTAKTPVTKTPAGPKAPPLRNQGTVTKPGNASKNGLTAAAEVHTGAMIALIPREDLIASLAVDGGEEAEQLHMTEVYLGQAADIPEDEKIRIIDVMSDFAARQFPVDGDAFSVNMFNPPGSTQSDGKDRDACVTLGISGHDIAAFHGELMDALERAGVEFPEQHEPRIPHVTLVYTDDADLSYFTDKTGPIVFDTLRIAFGGDNYDIPLGEGREELVASVIPFDFDPRQPRDRDGQWTDVPGGGGGLSHVVIENIRKMNAAQAKEVWAESMKKPTGTIIARKPRANKYDNHERIVVRDGELENQYETNDGEWRKLYELPKPADLRGVLKDKGWELSTTDEVEVAHVEKKYEPPQHDGGIDPKTAWDNREQYVDQIIAVNPYGNERMGVERDENGDAVFFTERVDSNGEEWGTSHKQHSTQEAAEKVLFNKYQKMEMVKPHSRDEHTTKPNDEAWKPAKYEDKTPASNEKPPRAENLPESWTSGAHTSEEAIADREAATTRRKGWPKDREALAQYTEANFAGLNKALRDEDETVDEGAFGSYKTESYAKTIDREMYKFPRDTTLFRQVGLNAFGIENLNDMKALEGQEFFDRGFVSTSLDPLNSIDDDSSSPVRIRITAPKGTRGAYLADLSSFPEEQEVLLGRGTKFRVSKVTLDEHGRALVEMEVVN